MDASVVILAHNEAPVIERQLEAVACQEFAGAFEIVVVDNRSTDETSCRVEAFASRVDTPQIRLVSAPERASIPYARNVGLRHARGEVVLWCDADDVVRPGWLQRMYNTVHGNNCIAAGRMSHGGPGSETSVGIFRHEYLDYAGNGNLAVPRDAVIQVGGYDETLPAYGGEDRDICWSLQEAGLTLEFVPEAVVQWTFTAPSQAVSKVYGIGRSDTAVALRHGDPVGEARLTALLLGLASALWGLRLLPVPPPHLKRTRLIRHVVERAGRLQGYFEYRILKPNPRRPLNNLGDTGA